MQKRKEKFSKYSKFTDAYEKLAMYIRIIIKKIILIYSYYVYFNIVECWAHDLHKPLCFLCFVSEYFRPMA